MSAVEFFTLRLTPYIHGDKTKTRSHWVFPPKGHVLNLTSAVLVPLRTKYVPRQTSSKKVKKNTQPSTPSNPNKHDYLLKVKAMTATLNSTATSPHYSTQTPLAPADGNESDDESSIGSLPPTYGEEENLEEGGEEYEGAVEMEGSDSDSDVSSDASTQNDDKALTSATLAILNNVTDRNVALNAAFGDDDEVGFRVERRQLNGSGNINEEEEDKMEFVVEIAGFYQPMYPPSAAAGAEYEYEYEYGDDEDEEEEEEEEEEGADRRFAEFSHIFDADENDASDDDDSDDEDFVPTSDMSRYIKRGGDDGGVLESCSDSDADMEAAFAAEEPNMSGEDDESDDDDFMDESSSSESEEDDSEFEEPSGESSDEEEEGEKEVSVPTPPTPPPANTPKKKREREEISEEATPAKEGTKKNKSNSNNNKNNKRKKKAKK